jgi:hypothetical protein
MKRIKMLAAVVASVVVLTSGAAHSEIANGTYSFDFSGIVPLWDISGSYLTSIGNFALDFSITEEPSGKLQGSGSFNVEGVNGDATVGGNIMGSSIDPDVAMKMHMSGTGTVQGVDVKLTFSAMLHYQLDSANRELADPRGSGTITIKDLATGQTASRGGTFRRSALSPLSLPENSTGRWTMSFDLTPNGNNYAGTASVETSTGATADFTVTGSYDSATDTSKIALTGDGGKLDLVISTSGALLNVESAKGKVFGQKVNYKAQ